MIREANHLHHPRYLGHQVAAPWPQAALVDLVAALLNQGMAIAEMGRCGVGAERAVSRWMTGLCGWGEEAGAVFTSGGSLGNLNALLAMRQARARSDVWQDGGHGFSVLVSEQAHYCIDRAARILGWGGEGAWSVPTDAEHRMRAPAAEGELRRARAQGREVLGVVASSCTTATGTYDPLPELAEFCEREGLWLHVDGAHGAGALVSPALRGRLEGIERADSLVWDAHKMLLVPALCTAVLFRDRRHRNSAFKQRADYLFGDGEADGLDPAEHTLECTKRMMALKLYAVLSALGPGRLQEHVEGCHGRARELWALVSEHPGLEAAHRPESNILCFRYRPARGGTPRAGLQPAIRAEVLRRGRHYIVQTRLRGEEWLRVTLMSPLTGRPHLEELVREVTEIGAFLEESRRA